MKAYLYEDEWKTIQGTQLTTNLKDSYLSSLEESLEKDHLFKIAEMLKEEGFQPEEFWLCEYPIQGVYCIDRIGEKPGVDYFVIQEDDGVLKPHYTTKKFIDGINDFPCNSIKESIEKMEC